MEQQDIISSLQLKAIKNHIDVIWTDGLEPSTPPAVYVPYRKIIMNLNWKDKHEIPFQLAHEIAHIFNNDEYNQILYYTNVRSHYKVERNAHSSAIDILLPYYYETTSIEDLNPLQFCELFKVPIYLLELVEQKMLNYYQET